MTSRLLVDKIESKSGNQIDMAANTLKMPAGHVIQEVSLPNTGRGGHVVTTSSSYSAVKTAWDLTITPKFSSSKILLLGNLSCIMGGSNKYGYVTIYRTVGSTNTDIGESPNGYGIMVVESDGGWTNMKLQHLDSPNQGAGTAITYKLYAKSDGYNDFYIGWSSASNTSTNLVYLTALEIAQ